MQNTDTKTYITVKDVDDCGLYIKLMDTAERYNHHAKTHELYWSTYRETKSHDDALYIAYQDLYYDTDYPN